MLALTGLTGVDVFAADLDGAAAFFTAPGLGVDFFDVLADPVVDFTALETDDAGFVDEDGPAFFIGAEPGFFAAAVFLLAVVIVLDAFDFAGAE